MKKYAIAVLVSLMLFALPVVAQPVFDDFFVTVGAGNVLEGGGTGFNGGTWYVYPTMWINQWFYDHPLDMNRGKVIHIEFDWVAYDPLCTTNMTVAVNWSTPEWSSLGFGETQPPLPGIDEELYIVREQMLYYCDFAEQMQHFIFDYTIEDYNPEWVSIDVMGCNFKILNGIIIHECVVDAELDTWGSVKAAYR
jgi:hypothetical protein